ncbi:MAG: hypothetical protein QXD51_04115 [Candidatus Anstonellales archaeon]
MAAKKSEQVKGDQRKPMPISDPMIDMILDLKVLEDTAKRINDRSFFYIVERIKNNPSQYTNQFVQNLINIANEISKNTSGDATEYAFCWLSSLLSNPKFSETYFPAILEIAKNTSEYATGEAFKSLDSLLSNPKFSETYFPAILEIAKKTFECAAEAFFCLDSFLSNPNFKPEWLDQYWDPVFTEILKNTSGNATGDAFFSLNTLLSNPKFSETYFPAILEIAKNTSGNATGDAFFSLNTLLSNPKFSETYFPAILEIAKNTSGNATIYALLCLNTLLSNPNFKPEWLDQYWKPVFTEILKNTSGNATEYAFSCLKSLLSNPNFKPAYLDKSNKHYIVPYIIHAIHKISKNTSGNATGYAFFSLNTLLSNPNFSEICFPAILEIAKNTSQYDIGYAFESLRHLLSTIDPSMVQESMSAFIELVKIKIIPTPLLVEEVRKNGTKNVIRIKSEIKRSLTSGNIEIKDDLTKDVFFGVFVKSNYGEFVKTLRYIKDVPKKRLGEELFKPFTMDVTKIKKEIKDADRKNAEEIRDEFLREIDKIKNISPEDIIKKQAEWDEEGIIPENAYAYYALYAIKTSNYANSIFEKIEHSQGVELVENLLLFFTDVLKNHGKIPLIESEDRMEILKRKGVELVENLLSSLENHGKIPLIKSEARIERLKRNINILQDTKNILQDPNLTTYDELVSAIDGAIEKLKEEGGYKEVTQELGKFKSLIKGRITRLETWVQRLGGIQSRLAKEVDEKATLTFNSQKLEIDAFAGYISSDCTKGRSEFFTCFMQDAWNVKIFNEDRWIGNMYIIEFGEYLIVDAIQIPFVNVNAQELWDGVIQKLLDVASKRGKTLLVSEFLSNYEEIKMGFNAKRYRTMSDLASLHESYPKKYRIFESSKKGFYVIQP